MYMYCARKIKKKRVCTQKHFNVKDDNFELGTGFGNGELINEMFQV